MQLNTYFHHFYRKVKKNALSRRAVCFFQKWVHPFRRLSGFYLLMVFVFFGWGCWTWKEVGRLSAQGQVNLAAVSPLNQLGLLEAVRSVVDSPGAPSPDEALRWVNYLQSIDDSSLDLEQRLKKYQHLGMASAVVSASSENVLRQRLWSSIAIAHNEEVLVILAQSKKMRRPDELNEAHTRLLLAMALHYFQDGVIEEAEIGIQFGNIDGAFLEEHGFCQNQLMRALADRNIIELPHRQQKYI